MSFLNELYICLALDMDVLANVYLCEFTKKRSDDIRPEVWAVNIACLCSMFPHLVDRVSLVLAILEFENCTCSQEEFMEVLHDTYNWWTGRILQNFPNFKCASFEEFNNYLQNCIKLVRVPEPELAWQ